MHRILYQEVKRGRREELVVFGGWDYFDTNRILKSFYDYIKPLAHGFYILQSTPPYAVDMSEWITIWTQCKKESKMEKAVKYIMRQMKKLRRSPQ